jgi:hypothetical protein
MTQHLPNYKTEMVSPYMVRSGDVLVVDGKHRTVNKKDIKFDSFWYPTIWGQPYIDKVERVLFKKFYGGKFLGYVSQP